MASKREQVIEAVVALLKATYPGASIVRNAAKPVGPNGSIMIRDGDPGEPDIYFSPLTYIYDHRIEVQFSVAPGNGADADQILDTMMAKLGAAIDADRTLGGLCDFVQAEPPSIDVIEAHGAVAGRSAETAVLATYGTPNPLT